MDESLPDGEQGIPSATADQQDGNYDVQELSVFWEQFLSANDESSRVSTHTEKKVFQDWVSSNSMF